ncbi:MAG TPA: restriction endonuclease subunit S [Saprospiraceae bacterium]|nr:restriction endonuclease subunit S [Saprospiraceae bacterium]
MNVKLSKIAEIIMGQSPDGSSYNTNRAGLPLLNGAADYKGNEFNPKKYTIAPKKISQKGDILMGIRATIGNLAISDKEYCIGRGLAAIRVNEGVCKEYIIHYLSEQIKTLAYNSSGSTIKGIVKEDLYDMQIPLPPLPVQKRIAEILDAADTLRRKDLELLKKYDELAQAIFIDMFGDPVRNEKGWEVGSFGDYITVLTDYHSNGSYETLRDHVKLSNVPDYALMVRTTDLEKNNFIENVNYISKEAYEYLDKSKVYGGEIIINKIGSAGNIYLMPNLNKPVSLGMNAFLVRLNDSLNPVFAYYFLNTDFGKYEISKRVFGAVTKTITKEAVRSIPMFRIPIKQQENFAKSIGIINNIYSFDIGGQSNILFQSLLQKAFKGDL